MEQKAAQELFECQSHDPVTFRWRDSTHGNKKSVPPGLGRLLQTPVQRKFAQQRESGLLTRTPMRQTIQSQLVLLSGWPLSEAHGQAEMMEFNYYLERGAIRRLPSGKYSVDYEKMPGEIANLAKELLEMEATGDHARAEAGFRKYDVIPPDLRQSLKKASAVPVDVDPLFSFPRKPH